MTFEFLQEDGINAELGLAASEDAIVDSLSEKAEKEIVFGNAGGKNLIGHCAPFLSKLCRNFSLMHKVNVCDPFYIYTMDELFYSLICWSLSWYFWPHWTESRPRIHHIVGIFICFSLVVMFFQVNSYITFIPLTFECPRNCKNTEL